MDLTNIKPCVECRHYDVCYRGARCLSNRAAHEATVTERIINIFVYGDDCFEEGDNGIC